MKIEPIAILCKPVGQLQANCYIVSDRRTGNAVIIDPGDESDFIAETILRGRLTPVAIFATHGHFDHVSAAWDLQNMFQVPFLMSEKDVFLLKTMNASIKKYTGATYARPVPALTVPVEDDAAYTYGGIRVTAHALPGHTPGGVGYEVKNSNAFFTGDIIFSSGVGGFGDTSHAYSDKNDFISSVRKILSYPPGIVCYPGHGDPINLALEKDAIQTSIDTVV